MSILKSQPAWTGAVSAYPYKAGMEKEFDRVDRFGEPFSLAYREGGMIMVPRGLTPMGKKDYRVWRKLPAAIDCEKPPRTQEQKDLISKSVALLKSGQNHIFDAPTGFGKSYCGCAIAVAMQQVALIVVPKDDLVKQWYNTLRDLIGIPVDKIGIIQQDSCEWQGKWFMIAMVHSLVIPDKYDPEMFQYPGMVIFDETHRMGADTFSIACRLFPAAHRLGMSATTSRSDGRDVIFKGHIGPVLVEGVTVPMRPKIIVKRTGWRTPPMWFKNDEGQWEKGNKVQAGNRMMKVFKAMGADTKRNAILVDFVLRAYKKGRTTLMVADLIDDHLKPLFHMLVAAGIKGEEMAYYTSKAPAAEKTRAKTTARVVLATYGMVAEGTDVPHWDTLVFCNPRANVTQTIGRIMRTCEGKVQPVAFDPLDEDPIFRGFYSSRERQYKSPKVGGELIWLK